MPNAGRSYARISSNQAGTAVGVKRRLTACSADDAASRLGVGRGARLQRLGGLLRQGQARVAPEFPLNPHAGARQHNTPPAWTSFVADSSSVAIDFVGWTST